MFQGRWSETLFNLMVGTILLAIGGAAGWMLHLERVTANLSTLIAVETAQDYATTDDVNNLRTYMDLKFDRLEEIMLDKFNNQKQGD